MYTQPKRFRAGLLRLRITGRPVPVFEQIFRKPFAVENRIAIRRQQQSIEAAGGAHGDLDRRITLPRCKIRILQRVSPILIENLVDAGAEHLDQVVVEEKSIRARWAAPTQSCGSGPWTKRAGACGLGTHNDVAIAKRFHALAGFLGHQMRGGGRERPRHRRDRDPRAFWPRR